MHLETELDQLLAEGVETARQREAASFDSLANSFGIRIVLFGAGGLGRRTLNALRQHGMEPLAFADNRCPAPGYTIDGIPVMRPEEAALQFGQNAIFVVTIWGAEGRDRMRDRISQLRQLGCKHVISFGPLYWKYPEGLLPHYGADLPHKLHEQSPDVRKAFGLWADDDSRREYLNQIRWRLFLDFDCLAGPVAHPIYFPADLCALSPDEVFIDCGAFDGDTVGLFLRESKGAFRKIVAFEPDPENFQHLEINASRMQEQTGRPILACHAATGLRRERLRLTAGGKASHVGAGEIEVDSVSLDEALADTAPTYIKMDIEGAELDALRGAKRIISEQTPVLAICCYHRQDHLWKVPLLIQSLSAEYKFYLRPHDLEMWDLVCYAIPKRRISGGV